MPIAHFTRPGRPSLAYDATAPAPGRPWVVFLGGFKSAMSGTKAGFLAARAEAAGAGFLRFDYSGHGQSAGRFTDGTIGGWTEEALALIDAVTANPPDTGGTGGTRDTGGTGDTAGGGDTGGTTGPGAAPSPLILAGSSMGVWIAVLAALARTERVAGLLGIAAACDFTEEAIAARLGPAERAAIAQQGWFERPSRYGDGPYRIAGALLDEARAHLVLRRPLPLTMPVRLIHGQADADIDWRTSLRLMAQITGADARLTLIKDGDHRLARPSDLAAIGAMLDDLLADG